MRTYILLVIVIIIAILSLWRQESSTIQTETAPQAEQHFPDYFMKNFTITGLSKQGQPEYKLQAHMMHHYAHNNSAELEKPFIEFMGENKHFTVNAERAVFFEDENLLHLYDNVDIQRKGSATQSELSIQTHYLKINTQLQTAETDQAAKVITDEAKLDTLGLKYDNTQKTLTLQSQVKGLYETHH